MKEFHVTRFKTRVSYFLVYIKDEYSLYTGNLFLTINWLQQSSALLSQKRQNIKYNTGLTILNTVYLILHKKNPSV